MYNPNIFNARSGVSAVTASTPQPGWVGGDISNLAASGTVDVIFDLGANWDSYSKVQVGHTAISLSSGIIVNSVKSSSDATSSTDDISLNTDGATGMSAFGAASGAGSRSAFFRPMDRYLIINISNADAVNAVGAGASVKITAYPNGC